MKVDGISCARYKFLVGTQGFLYGTIGKNEKMSGDNVAYIYPGKANLSLISKFKNNIMISGRKAVI